MKGKSFLEFYREHKISPVRQDIKNYRIHKKKREELYRQLGLLPNYFKGKKVIEVGPGGGFNSLVVADWEPLEYTLVEANETGIKHINGNFLKHPFKKSNKLKIIHTSIEKYKSNELFDIVICEGMIPGLPNQKEVLKKLDKLLLPGGTLVVTCVDEISAFFDIMKKFFAHELTKNMPSLREKIDILIMAFKPHRDRLIGASKLIEDWVVDVLINDVVFNPLFSISECINYFKENYQIYNTSPKIFTDFRWFKQIPEDILDHNALTLLQFDEIRHNLFYCHSVLKKRAKQKNIELLRLCQKIRRLVYAIEKENKNVINELQHTITLIIDNLSNIDGEIVIALKEIKQLLKIKNLNIEDISTRFPHFIKAFGRCTQYVSLTKNNRKI